MSPKSLFRHPEVMSPIEELTKGRFQEIIDDKNVDKKKVKKVVLCTGKVYFDLKKEREENKCKDTAIVRLEQLYPIPKKQMAALKSSYKNARFIWVQEEPRLNEYR